MALRESQIQATSNAHLKRDLMPATLHPNEEGYRVWARAMESAAKKFLGKEQVDRQVQDQ